MASRPICPGPGKKSWPELVGANGHVAAAKIERDNGNVDAVVLVEGSPTTKDINCGRVRVWVDRRGTVTRTPTVG